MYIIYYINNKRTKEIITFAYLSNKISVSCIEPTHLYRTNPFNLQIQGSSKTCGVKNNGQMRSKTDPKHNKMLKTSITFTLKSSPRDPIVNSDPRP